MSERILVQGVVLSASPVGEYDKRVVLLTRERGKIAAFARGARRPGSPLMAAASPFVFGTFFLYEGRTSYSLEQVQIRRQFSELASLFPGIYYGYYFLELADYFGQEGTDEKDMMNLLYLSALALLNPSLEDRLVRCVFELRVMTMQGYMPSIFSCASCRKEPLKEEGLSFSQNAHGVVCETCRKRFTGQVGYSGKGDMEPLSFTALRGMQWICAAPLEKLYTFAVTGQVLEELERVIHGYVERNTDRRFKSLGILQQMTGGA